MRRHTTGTVNWRVGRSWPFGLPAEHPIRISEFSDRIKSLSWAATNIRPSLTEVFEEVSRLAGAEIFYYYSRRKAASFRAKIFRFCSWLSGSIGILTPVLAPLIEEAPENFLSWGYLAVAIAGIFVVADNVFSGSGAHARFVATQLRVEHSFTNFALEWQALLLVYDSDPGPVKALSLLEKATSYLDKLHDSLGEETSEWRATLNNVREELKRQGSNRSENS